MTTAHRATNDIAKLTAGQILAIDAGEPERLFTGDKDILKGEFRTLAKLWHPDLNKDKKAKEVFARINALHAGAEEKLAAGAWTIPGLLRLTSNDGRAYELRYVKKHPFELGAFYIAKNLVAFVIEKRLGDDLAANGLDAIKYIAYADDKMRKEFSGKMPELVKTFDTGEATVCVFKKDPDMVLLADLRDYIAQATGKPLDPKHAAWVMSRLHSLTCFLQTNGLTHNAIAAKTLFVSPAMHTAALLGGWWYAARENTNLKGLPGAALDNVPRDVLASGKATRRVDLELIRAVGRDLLGDRTGSLILRDKKVPAPMAQWLTNSTSGDAFEDFRGWSDEVLKNSFGARRFTELKVSFSDVYGPK